MGAYRFLDHTADIALEVTGETLEGVFAQAGVGLFALVFDGPVSPAGEVGVAVSSVDREGLLVAWLNQLLFLHDTEGWVFTRFEVTLREIPAAGRPGPGDRSEPAGICLEGRAWGGKPEPGAGRFREVKAATYHGLSISATAPYRATIIFDL